MRHKDLKLPKRFVKKRTNVPSLVFLAAAGAAIAASATLKCLNKDRNALFVGQWVAPFMILGLYARRQKCKRH